MASQGNIICSLCSACTAIELCCCNYPSKPFCLSCKFKHRQMKDGLHLSLSLANSGSVGTREGYIKVRDRLVQISNAQSLLSSGMEEIATCREAINAAQADAICRITAAVEENLAALEQLESVLRELMAAASSDILEHAHENGYMPESFAARTILHYTSDPSSFDIFKWKVSVFQRDLEVRINISFWTPFPETSILERKRNLDIDNPLGGGDVIGMSANLESLYSDVRENEDKLAFVLDKEIRFYSCLKEQWTPTIALNPSILADDRSAYCILEDSSVLCCGGGPNKVPWDCAYLISQLGGTRELRRLLGPRRRHGVSVYRGFVYLFGGWSLQQLQSSERIRASPVSALPNKEWTRVSDMLNTRSSFNPCCYNDQIYICGGAHCQVAEVYYPVEELHFLLNFALPDGSETFCTVNAESLIVVSKEYVSVLYSNNSQYFKPSPQANIWGSMTPIRVANFVFVPYLLPNVAFVERFDLTTTEMEKIYMPDY